MMKHVFYPILALATLFAAASCSREPQGTVPGGKTADITLSVSLGAQTRAFADGTTVDKLYVGLYEAGESSWTWVADNADEPAAVSGKTATVTFQGKLVPGQSYRVVFWAQKDGAPYTLDWARTATTGPSVTASYTGVANDESRDAFCGTYDTGVVTGSIDLTNTPVSLKRPFAQVNVLIPNSVISNPQASILSSMSVASAPTVLNLATRETSVPEDWTFSESAIQESAFGSYATTHKYAAMNYVLVDQLTGSPKYDVRFSVTAGSKVSGEKEVKEAPLSPNGRTNIVGNIFKDDFSITAPELISPDFDGEQDITDITNVKQPQTLYFTNESEEVTEGDAYTLQIVGGAETEVTYTSSDENVATIDGTDIQLVGPGQTVITATAAEDDDYLSASASYTLTVFKLIMPDFTNIAEIKNLLGEESETFTGRLSNAVVSFVAGTSDAVIKDETGSILYHRESGHDLLQGQTISGDVIIEGEVYNGIKEITMLAATVNGEGCAVEPEVVTLAQLVANYDAYESAYVKVVGVESLITRATKGNINVRQDGTNYVVYTNVAIPVNEGDIFTAEGTVTEYNTTKQLKVWKSADLTVTQAAPVLSASPAAPTVAATVTSVTWTISSNTDWTITPGTGVTSSVLSGNGNADVTLNFAANEGTTARTFTATVSATGCEDVVITITQNGAGSSQLVEDVITANALPAASTTYVDFSNESFTSPARYAGNSAKSSSGGIQFRSKNGNSGIVSTISGGLVKTVTITVESGTNTVQVYGRNTAYASAFDLFGDTPGTLIGSLSETGTVTITDDYEYVGIRSGNGAIYITEIKIAWQ